MIQEIIKKTYAVIDYDGNVEEFQNRAEAGKKQLKCDKKMFNLITKGFRKDSLYLVHSQLPRYDNNFLFYGKILIAINISFVEGRLFAKVGSSIPTYLGGVGRIFQYKGMIPYHRPDPKELKKVFKENYYEQVKDAWLKAPSHLTFQDVSNTFGKDYYADFIEIQKL